MALFEPAIQQALDDDGDPIGGAVWYFYTTGGLTPAAVYADDLLVTSLGSSVTANASGRFANIYLDDAVTYRAILKDGVAGSTIKDIDPISASETADTIGNWWVDIRALGADPTGVADCASIINTAIATGKDVFVPKGTYKVASALTQLATDQSFFGTGPQSVLRFTANDRCLTVGTRSQVRDLCIVGDGAGAGKPFQTGVFCFAKRGWLISNVDFRDISGAAQANGGGAICVALLDSAETEGGRVSNIRMADCNGGFVTLQRGEYVLVSNAVADNCTVGFYCPAGNLVLSNCNAQHCDYGVKMEAVANDAHGSLIGCLLNHNTYNLWADGITNGMSLVSCHLFYGNITLNGCNGFRFVSCDLSGDGATHTLTLDGNCTNISVAISRFPKTPDADCLVLALNGDTITETANQDW